MRMPKPIRAIAASAAIISLVAACAPGGPPTGQPQTVAQRSTSDQRVGDENHPKLVAQFGGEVSDKALKDYVNGIGARIAAVSEQPNAKWTFTVLDSPVVNAFALPGGYIYVTRGLMALANSEAELAGVVAHEVAHVTAAHGAQRQRQAGIAQIGVLAATIGAAILGASSQSVQAINQLGNTAGAGFVASYSREDEFEADQLSVSYLARAGYDPDAAADFLASLQEETTLQAEIAGGSYNPNRVDFLATHPATAQRVREATRRASLETGEGERNEEGHLRRIDGMVYGDSAEQGFVDGRTFSHPKLRFTFTMPEGFVIRNSSAQVTATGPNGSGIIFSGDGYNGGSMDAYIARQWAPAIARQARTGRLTDLRRRTINGMPAASALLPVETRSGVRILRLTAIRKGDTIYRFLGNQPQGADRLGQAMDRAAGSFASLSSAQASRLKPLRIDVRTVRRGDTVEALARRMAVPDRQVQRFRVLNGLKAGEGLRAGEKVKLIVR
ncbi:MAG: M48 family metalloprotease [Pseudomonadota bacterium]